MLGDRVGRWARESQWCWSAPSGIWAVEPGVMAEEMDAKGSEVTVRASEEGMPTRRVYFPAGSDTPAPTPRGSFLHQWLFLSPV